MIEILRPKGFYKKQNVTLIILFFENQSRYIRMTFSKNRTDANICKRITSKRPQRQTKVKHLLHPFHISERSLFNWHNIALIFTHRNYLPPAVNRRPGFHRKSSATIQIQYQSNRCSTSKIPTSIFSWSTRVSTMTWNVRMARCYYFYTATI